MLEPPREFLVALTTALRRRMMRNAETRTTSKIMTDAAMIPPSSLFVRPPDEVGDGSTLGTVSGSSVILGTAADDVAVFARDV